MSSDEFKAHFLGTHFFNPPRYLKLLEIIPTPDTAPEVVDFFKHLAARCWARALWFARIRPTSSATVSLPWPASYGDRVGVCQDGYTVSEIDAITGPLIGRPKSATFRLMDLVGLDVMGHVNRNLYDGRSPRPLPRRF